MNTNEELKQYLLMDGDYWAECREKALESKTKAFSKSKPEKRIRIGFEKKLFELANDKEQTLSLLNSIDLYKRLVMICDVDQREGFILGNDVHFMMPLVAVLRSKNKYAIEKCFLENPNDEKLNKFISDNLFAVTLAAMRANCLELIKNNKAIHAAYQYTSIQEDYYSSLMEEDLDVLNEENKYMLVGINSLCVKQNHPEVIKFLAVEAFSRKPLFDSSSMESANRFLTELINNGYYKQATECFKKLNGKVLMSGSEPIMPKVKFSSILKYWDSKKDDKPKTYQQFEELLKEMLAYCEKFESKLLNLNAINQTYVEISNYFGILEKSMQYQKEKNNLINRTEWAIADKLMNNNDFKITVEFSEWLKQNPDVVTKIVSHMSMTFLEKLYSNKYKKIEQIKNQEYQGFMARVDSFMQKAQITWRNFSWSGFSEMMLKEEISKNLTNRFQYEQNLGDEYERMRLEICKELTHRSIGSHIKPVKEHQPIPQQKLNRF